VSGVCEDPFEKTAVLDDHDITYKITGLIPAGKSSVTLEDIMTGNGQFVGTVSMTVLGGNLTSPDDGKSIDGATSFTFEITSDGAG
jgi:hypothetical protein